MRKLLLTGTAVLAVFIAPAALSQTSLFKPNASTTSEAMSVDSRGVLTMAPLLERVSPAVVSIRTEGKVPEKTDDVTDERQEMLERFFGRKFEAPQQQRRSGSVGSGVIVDADAGYILTNHHVVKDAGDITVVLKDRREYIATLVGGDEKTDIAVLKIEAKNLRDVEFAPNDSAKVGDYVIAIGNPFGLGHTVTSGIVSALGRQISGGDRYQDFIQTDASINPGNSGGALVNSKGELIGINSAIISRSGGNNGIGFAVPTKMAHSVMNQLVAYGEVRRGRIGVSIRNIDPAFQEAYGLSTLEGAFVNNVVEGSAADKAGLKAEDVIIEFNGEIIRDASDISNAVGLVEPGVRTELTYLRDNKRRTTKISVEEFDDEPEVLDAESRDDIPAMESFSGASITNIPEDMTLRGGSAGAFVASVSPGSKAARAGLAKGDIIRRVGRTQIADLGDFEDAIKKKDGPIALTVERDGTNLFLAVR
ncbi:MAG: DegQ family serine endoprotease [Alphaproteobacteria bacterium]